MGCATALKVQKKITNNVMDIKDSPLKDFIRPQYPSLVIVDPPPAQGLSQHFTTDMDEDEASIASANTVTTALASQISNTPKKAPAIEEFKGYINLRLRIAANPDPADPQKAWDILFERCIPSGGSDSYRGTL